MKLALYLIMVAATLNQYWIARAIQGEGADLMDDPVAAGRAIAHTILERRNAGWCDTIEQCVREGYWGISNVEFPDEWAIAIAKEIGPKKTNAVYVMSFEDCKKLKIDKGQAVLVMTGSHHALYFFERDLKWILEAEQGNLMTSNSEKRKSVKTK